MQAGAAEIPRPVYRFKYGQTFPMNGTLWDDQILLEGWHMAEAWGRWMDG